MKKSNNNVVFVFLITIASSAVAITSFSNGSPMDHVLCKENERQALLNFKQDLEDPMNRLSSWIADGEGADCCSWTSVACDDSTGHVIELHLGNPYDVYTETEAYLGSMFGGKINPSLLNLNFLNYLNLSGNLFGGISIPPFIGSLKSLTHLDLSNAGFGGVIPHQLGNLSNLCYLNLGDRYMNVDLKVDKLEWISRLRSLRFLSIRRVDMSKAYDWLQALNTLPSLVELRLPTCGLLGHISNPHLPMTINFTSLSIFDVSYNYGFGLPKWLFNLKSLHALYLSGVRFNESFMLDLTNMTNLKILDLSDNYYSTISRWIGRLNHLEYLDLSFNQLQGNIPEFIGNLTSMVSLHLSENLLEGEILESFGSLPRLRELGLSDNLLSGDQLTNQLGKLSKLQHFDVSGNQLNGSFPKSFSQLAKLEYFDISGNQLNGSFPESIGQLAKLEYFDISGNRLNGSIPESFGQLAKLEYFDISDNALKGVVHEVHFANLSRLKVLRASGNSLSLETSPDWVPPFQLEDLMLDSWHLGTKLPLWLRWQQHLSKLGLSNAGIVSTIPIWFCNISSQLYSLNLSNNQFHGSFPCPIHPQMVRIDISYNHFSGSLMPIISPPHKVQDLNFISAPRIAVIDFSHNSFSGSVTPLFCNSTTRFLESCLFLGNNLLTGEIPNFSVKYYSVSVLHLENNNLVGVIPPSMENLFGLQSLNLRNNRLSGEFPSFLREHLFLATLDLSGNKFTGTIPGWVGVSLSHLVVLNLRSNNFEGDIPLQLCHLTRLQVLDLAQNNLSGKIPRCFYNLTGMIEPPNSPGTSFGLTRTHEDRYNWMQEAEVVTKGRELQYSSVLLLVRSMDLSGNNFHGEIPVEFTRLNLQTLNLSQNHLAGTIPSEIGNMRWLESLDLSQNQLSGEIPPSISSLSFLSYLNLSCNNLTGRIPTSSQLQGFNESSFIGNHLCGPPLPQNCSASDQSMNPPTGVVKQDNYLYLSLGLGFAFGFWAVLGSLLFNLPWSLAFSRVVDRAVLKLCGFIIEFF